jgi:hypothetical protein
MIYRRGAVFFQENPEALCVYEQQAKLRKAAGGADRGKCRDSLHYPISVSLAPNPPSGSRSPTSRKLYLRSWQLRIARQYKRDETRQLPSEFAENAILARVDEFREANGFRSPAAAIRWLLDSALNRDGF